MAASRSKSLEPVNSSASASSETWPILPRAPGIWARRRGISRAAALARASGARGSTATPPNAGRPARRAFR